VSRRLVWAKGGGSAVIVALSGEIVTLRSTTPAPPGARLEATLEPPPAGDEGEAPERAAPREAPLALKLKSHGSRRDGDAFVLTARLLDATREVRAAVAAVAALAAPGT
jgi:hypothetical protein